MKQFQTLAIWTVVCAVSIAALAEQIPETGLLFTGLTYRYSYLQPGLEPSRSWFGCSRQSSRAKPTWVAKSCSEALSQGTYWAVMIGGDKVYITAAHVLGLNTTPTEINGVKIDNEHGKLLFVKGRAYMGTLAYTVEQVGRVPSLDDVAFFRPHEKNIVDKVGAIPLASNAPVSGERVSVVGFPGTAYQQLTEMVVTSVHETEGFMILNQPVDPGCSGGVVIDAAGRAYGVVANTDAKNKQTTVLRLTRDSLQQVRWTEAKTTLSHKFD